MNDSTKRLVVTNHDRDSDEYRYVYPVVSRRAGGVSVGINLNPNNACNFRCVYCQVPGLISGKGPSIDVPQLARELGEMLERITHGSFFVDRVAEGSRRLNDIALSGNGEPTSSPDLRAVVEVIAAARQAFSLRPSVKTVLITNGTLCHQVEVLDALEALAALSGEVWFKLDSATAEGMWRTNSTRLSPDEQRRKLVLAANRCNTWLQTCAFSRQGHPPSDAERDAYVALARGLVAEGVPVRGVLLYGLARASHQPEAAELSPAPLEWMNDFKARIEDAGLPVKLTP